MRDKLGLSTRDLIWIGTLIVGWVVNYAAVTATVTARLANVERTVERVEARLWEMRGSRPAFLGIAPEPCAQDATAVRLTMTEVEYGQDR